MLNAPEPAVSSTLLEYAGALSWMEASLPSYIEALALLQERLMRAARAAGRNAKKAAARIKLADAGWGESEAAAFEKANSLLHGAMKLTHPPSDLQVRLFSDASGGCCATPAAQVSREGLGLRLASQSHELLACLSAMVRGAASRWAKAEKEAYAIIDACGRFEYACL